jgi:hypothetical protein
MVRTHVKWLVRVVALVAGLSFWHGANAQQPTGALGNQSAMARVPYACSVIMGLQGYDVLYGVCTRSLGHTLSRLGEGQLISKEEGACLRLGLTPGTPSFATCVEKRLGS